MSVQQSTLPSGVIIITVNGRLDQAQTSELESQIAEALDQTEPRIVIDLSQSNYINSGGLRTLVTGWRKAKQLDGELVLSGLNERLSSIFQMVGFDKVFTIYQTDQEATEALTISNE